VAGVPIARLAILALALVSPLPAGAVDLGRPGSPLSGSFNTTISLGASLRVAERDQRLIGRENGGTANSINGDNGNLNYDAGDLVSGSGKITHELLLSCGDVDAFVRGFYFYDAVIMDKETRRTAISRSAQNESGRDAELLDAYIAARFRMGSAYLTLRAGNQVVNWGESVFIGNGISTISPVDVSKLRVAGAEIREAFKGIPLVRLDASLGERFSIEGFYELAWDHTEIEPEGTFFSTSDVAGPGAKYIYLGFGRPGISDNPPLTGDNGAVGLAWLRSSDHDACHEGQFGVALRWYEPRLNGTEFGFYFTRLHSRLPLISGRAGTLERLQAGDYAGSAEYFREFPEDIDTYGISFNTDLPFSGIALQGECSYHRNQPLQVDGVEWSFAMLSPLDPYLSEGNPDAVIFGNSQLGTYGFEDEVCGYRRKDVIQAQMGLTKVWGPRLGADQYLLVGEVGGTFIQNMEDATELRYESPGTSTSGTQFFTDAGIQPETQTGGFPDAGSWGYRLLVGANYNNAIGPVTLQPRVAFYHDVSGTTPSPIGNFVEERMTVSASVTATFLISWNTKLSYANSFGAGAFNQRNDRDFVSLTASYSF
jgi:hypothetical protein